MTTTDAGTRSVERSSTEEIGRILDRDAASSTWESGVLASRQGLSPMKLSIMMPAFNEEATVAHAVHRVLSVDYPCAFELIAVDDGSGDLTGSILKAIEHPNLVVLQHAHNRGKGAALQTAGAAATGTHVVPFDADLEYEPADLVTMALSVMGGNGEVVYGSRVLGANGRFQSHAHMLGNRALTMALNMAFASQLSDMHTCLKLLPTELFRELDLQENGFGLDTEVTAKLLMLGIGPWEVPVSYSSRSVAQGKKITWHDGVECLRILTRIRRGAASRSAHPGAGRGPRWVPVGAPLLETAMPDGMSEAAAG
jgi:glycosyltransferase involved in cell wall biosynthesis